MAIRIDGKLMARELIEQVALKTKALRSESDLEVGLAVVLVGEDPASQVYVRNKLRSAEAAGIRSFEHRLSADCTQSDLEALLDELNNDASVHGILVQLPLPKHLDEEKIIERIALAKDVDGFHPLNVGALSAGLPSLVPCTPQGCMMMLHQQLGDLSGLHAVVIGRSNIVGKPMAALLLQANCTVTIVHSRSQDIETLCAQADIVVAAVGQPELVKASWLKPKAVVIDVGINRVERAGKAQLVGDVDYAACASKARAITPVPGGVGPMTVACLMNNTLLAAKQQMSASTT